MEFKRFLQKDRMLIFIKDNFAYFNDRHLPTENFEPNNSYCVAFYCPEFEFVNNYSLKSKNEIITTGIGLPEFCSKIESNNGRVFLPKLF